MSWVPVGPGICASRRTDDRLLATAAILEEDLAQGGESIGPGRWRSYSYSYSYSNRLDMFYSNLSSKETPNDMS